MAQDLNTQRNKILTSIHGRRLGIDHQGFLIGSPARGQVTNATSDTTGTAIPNNGVHSVITTTDDGWTLTDPQPGCEVTLMTGSTSTGTHAITPAAATIVSTNGVAGSSISMAALGARITLVGLSTASWGVKSAQAATVSS